MRFTRASCSVADMEDFRANTVISLTTDESSIIRGRSRGGNGGNDLYLPDFDIRKEKANPVDGDEESLFDWFEVFTTSIQVVGSTLQVDGFMRGTCGKIRDGKHPKGGNLFNYDGDEGEPFLRVSWRLF